MIIRIIDEIDLFSSSTAEVYIEILLGDCLISTRGQTPNQVFKELMCYIKREDLAWTDHPNIAIRLEGDNWIVLDLNICSYYPKKESEIFTPNANLAALKVSTLQGRGPYKHSLDAFISGAFTDIYYSKIGNSYITATQGNRIVNTVHDSMWVTVPKGDIGKVYNDMFSGQQIFIPAKPPFAKVNEPSDVDKLINAYTKAVK